MKITPTLKTKILRGGIYLTLRQLLGVGLSLISVLVIARVLGPERYGVVAIASSFLYFTFGTANLGLDIYLVRQPNLLEDAPEQILAFYNTVGVAFCVLLWFAIPTIGLWTGQTVISQILRWLVPVVWLQMVSSVSIAMLERELRFAQVGLIETLAQAANYLLAVPLVLLHWGYWGPIAGLGLQFTVLALLGSCYYLVPWRWRWRWQFLGSALGYSLMYTGSTWIWNLKSLTVPLFVSRMAGLEAVGIVSVAMRFADQLGILRLVAYRLSISGLAKLNGNPDLIRHAISRGIVYQGLLIGPLYAVFSCCAALVIPLLFGGNWLQSVKVFPCIALAMLINTIFNLHSSALYVAGHNRDVAQFHLWHIGLLWLASWLLIPVLGLWGYPAAEIVALLSYISLHYSLIKLCGSPNYWDGFWLLAATAPALLAGPWLQPAFGLGALAISYGLVFSLRSGLRRIPSELYSAWRSRNSALMSSS